MRRINISFLHVELSSEESHSVLSQCFELVAIDPVTLTTCHRVKNTLFVTLKV